MKFSFRDLFSSIQSDMLKMTLKQGLSGIMNGVGTGGSSLSSGNNQGGLLSGIFGSIGSLFGGSSGFAGFFANGGTSRPGKAHIVGDGGQPELFIPNSVGSITPLSNLSGQGSNVTVNMHVQTPDIVSFNYSQGQIAADMARQIRKASRNL